MKIRVINPIPEGVGISTEGDIARLKAAERPGTEISVAYIKSGKPYIIGDYEDSLAVPGTIQAAIQAEREGMDAIIINCTADTGVSACRECVTIPVVTAMETSMYLAAQLSHKFSVLTFSNDTIVRYESMAWKFGLWHKLASVRSIEIQLAQMDHEDPNFVDALYRLGKKCVEEDNAHSLIMGCTAFELVSKPLQDFFRQAGIPILIIEPYAISVRMAETLAILKISQSKLSYPMPKDIQAF
jgi:allantoin racemase